jgi:LPXTG-site transpeptidase (sortase) family protein
VVNRHWPVAVFAAGVVVLSGGLVALSPWRSPAPARPAAAATPVPIISPDAFPTPVATPLPSSSPEAGLRVKVPELGIDLEVVDGDGWNTPYYKAAHYPGMKWPGQGGRSLIYAHAQKGMFGPLFNGHTGLEVDVTRPDGTSLRYTVTQYYRSWPARDTRWLQPADHEELVLLTCTTYNPNDPRIIAVAEPAG